MDSDGDGMPERWETKHGLDDPNGDSDRDGRLNIEEYEIGTNSTDPDSDDDGVGDGAEVRLGTDPHDVSDSPDCPLVYYVSASGNDGNNCLSPTSPCKTLQHAIDIAYGTELCPVTIRVAAGVYAEHLLMDSWESLEGGWNSDFGQRWDFETGGLDPDPEYASVIDGEGNGGSCLTLNNVNGVMVKWFKIQSADEIGVDEYGWPTLPGGEGRGAFCNDSSVKSKHCVFSNNYLRSAGTRGMALWNMDSSSPIRNSNADPYIVNCLFANNFSFDGGGVIGNWNSSPQLLIARLLIAAVRLAVRSRICSQAHRRSPTAYSGCMTHFTLIRGRLS